ncbi:hypothetical protein [Paenibacillus sp. KN14-4R]|uniref:hypothetical protein n=1 Tax=Paenibacillus sp. KN14-4R TaxID=3445773 RepID=UPI003F9F44D6
MDLKEFDIDLPYLAEIKRVQAIMEERGCLFQEATKIDYEMNWKGMRRTIRLETRCMTSMFERLFNKLKTEDCWKVLVECVSEIKEERILNFSGVCTVQVPFSYREFLESDDENKKIASLEILMEGIRIVALYKGWIIEPFERVYRSIKEQLYKNDWVWKKPLKSPDGKYIAEVLCQHNVKSMDIVLIVKAKDGTEVNRNKIISELPDEFAYAKHLGKLEWLSINEVALVSKKGDNSWSTQIE